MAEVVGAVRGGLGLTSTEVVQILGRETWRYVDTDCMFERSEFRECPHAFSRGSGP